MEMKKCEFCKKEMPKKEKTCPHCGEEQPLMGCVYAVYALLALFILGALKSCFFG